jgi:hypothetical protein
MPGAITPAQQQHQTGQSRLTQVQQAANSHKVPFWVLWGVYGLETTWGKNVKTSSAGAIGDFQFLPSTASTYNYPLTNTPNGAQFNQQADAAAAYLAALYKQTGSWDAALQHYSGGGYGEAAVKAKGSQNLGDQSVVGDTINAVGDAINKAGDVLSVPGKFLGLVTNAQTWLRLVEIIGGMALLLLGLRSLTGASNDPVQLAGALA